MGKPQEPQPSTSAGCRSNKLISGPFTPENIESIKCAQLKMENTQEPQPSTSASCRGAVKNPPVKGGQKTVMEETLKNLDIKKMYKLMQCVGCGHLPSPYYRFLCSKGHMFCRNCGEERFTENSPGTCQAMVTLEGKENTEGEISTPCPESIQRYPADPVYCALYLRAKWQCPNVKTCLDFVTTCAAIVDGSDLFEHMAQGQCKPDCDVEEILD